MSTGFIDQLHRYDERLAIIQPISSKVTLVTRKKFVAMNLGTLPAAESVNLQLQ
jgi:hypothetical protein